jgi:hypothetical protein
MASFHELADSNEFLNSFHDSIFSVELLVPFKLELCISFKLIDNILFAFSISPLYSLLSPFQTDVIILFAYSFAFSLFHDSS